MEIGEDPKIGAEQKGTTFWKRVHVKVLVIDQRG
jgi:hypothetical protein